MVDIHEPDSYWRHLDESVAKATAWRCTCRALNPEHYDSCIECQRPSWVCECGAVNPQGAYRCQRCGNEPRKEQ